MQRKCALHLGADEDRPRARLVLVLQTESTCRENDDPSFTSHKQMQALLLSTLAALIACLSYLLLAQPARIMPAPARNQLGVLASRAEWQQALDSLPDAASLNGRIPSFFFAHGHPTLLWPKDLHNSREGMVGGV
jgi:hypothetical protein